LHEDAPKVEMPKIVSERIERMKGKVKWWNKKNKKKSFYASNI
jgi:hypothetical protein